MLGTSSLASLPYLRSYKSRRASSYDTAGNNKDSWDIEPGQTSTIFESPSPGCVKHVWVTMWVDEPHFLRKIILRAYWDGEEHPSIEAPIGDFFGIGHGLMRNFVSAPLQMSPQEGRSFNCWWPMPFDSARISIENECEKKLMLYFYVDWEDCNAGILPANPEPYEQSADAGRMPALPARFHAQWRREGCTEGWLTERLNNDNIEEIWSRKPNLTDADNYLILEAEGDGIYVGCNLNVDCFQRQGNDWYGEGDDMIVIDGEPWPPRLHGTGTEDYFGTAFCPREVYHAPYHGLTVYSGNSDWPWKGKNSLYRYHIEDPIRFEKSIRVSIEHGHANKLSNDYSSTAYWYQLEPHKRFAPLLGVMERLPRHNEPEFP